MIKITRENRVKEYMFPTYTFTAATAGSTLYSESPLNGDILEIKTTFNRAGSVTMFESGNATNLFFNKANLSGTNPTYAYPRLLTQAATGSATGYGTNESFVINGQFGMTVGSVASGTSANLGVRVRYR